MPKNKEQITEETKQELDAMVDSLQKFCEDRGISSIIAYSYPVKENERSLHIDLFGYPTVVGAMISGIYKDFKEKMLGNKK